MTIQVQAVEGFLASVQHWVGDVPRRVLELEHCVDDGHDERVALAADEEIRCNGLLASPNCEDALLFGVQNERLGTGPAIVVANGLETGDNSTTIGNL